MGNRLFLKIGIVLLLFMAGVLTAYTISVNNIIQEKFEGKRWALPAVVYARPLELYSDMVLAPDMFEEELQLGGYRKEAEALVPGGYDRNLETFRLVTRDFSYPEGMEQSVSLTITFFENRIQKIHRTGSDKEILLARIDPARIGSFHPLQHEDRVVLKREEIPELFVNTLLLIEDKNFYSHSGIRPRAMVRAFLANVKAGKTVQGGSTLTQQLVKNFFLTNERTITRKLNEAMMALLLEMHYSKDEILTAYVNEVFMGQDGGRAIHGFGLASLFYFRRNLENLLPEQIALLVGMIKGPSYYNPHTQQAHCHTRQQLVLDLMYKQNLLDKDTYRKAQDTTIAQIVEGKSGFNRFPAFLELVHKQLQQEYREEDITSEGLKILSTLDPGIQLQVEKKLAETINQLENSHSLEKTEGAVVVAKRANGEILAVAGGRTPHDNGFNRALHARRPIGSLIKPAVFLTALANGYTLASPIVDSMPATAEETDIPPSWHPKNFDRKEHGTVPLYEALAQSYNLATVNVGLTTGLEKVLQTAKSLGLPKEEGIYPSFLLGSAEMAPMDILKMYQTLAAGGFYQGQRVIRSVLKTDNTTLRRFSLDIEQRFSPERVYLINHALQRAVSEGTGKSLHTYLPTSLGTAGKTGTSNRLRDSWFAGFTGDLVAVTWLGRDDNTPVGLTGASGALAVWGSIMESLHVQPLELIEPPGITWAHISGESYSPAFTEKKHSIYLPFLEGSEPAPSNIFQKLQKAGNDAIEKLNDVFGE